MGCVKSIFSVLAMGALGALVSCAGPVATSASATVATPAAVTPAVSMPVANSAVPAATVPAAPAAPHRNTAIVPRLNSGFTAKHTQNVAVAKKGDIDVLFMGDSITDFWRNNPRPGAPTDGSAPTAGKPVLDKYFGDWKLANFGIAGDTTQGVLFRLQNGEGEGFKPKAIMMMIGTNNISGNNSPAEIAMGVAADVFELRKDFPDAKILLLGIFPRNAPNSPFRPKIAEINRIISTLNDEQHIFYMDIGDKFLSPDGTIARDVMADGLHPTTKGYEIWALAVKETLEGFLK